MTVLKPLQEYIIDRPTEAQAFIQITILQSCVISSRINRTIIFNMQRLLAQDVTTQYHQKLDKEIEETNESDYVSDLWVIHLAQKVMGTTQ